LDAKAVEEEVQQCAGLLGSVRISFSGKGYRVDELQ
jgi:hypothetical protein